VGGHHPEENITDPRNMRMEDMSRRQRRMKVSSEGRQGTDGAVAPEMDGWMFLGSMWENKKIVDQMVAGVN